jgi:hypothetical protein
VADGYTPYVPGNPLMGYCNPLVAVCERQEIMDPNHWQPVDLHERPGRAWTPEVGQKRRVGESRSSSPRTGNASPPFALTSSSQFDDILTIPPPDYLKNSGQYQSDVNDMIQFSRSLDTGGS